MTRPLEVLRVQSGVRLASGHCLLLEWVSAVTADM